MSLRILHVLDHSWPVLDGYAQRSRSIVEAQAQIGMYPRVLTSSLHQADDPAASEINLDGVRYARTPAIGVRGRVIQRRVPVLREMAVVHLLRERLENLLETESFDVVHAHSPALCGLAAWQAARSRRLPFVYEIRSFWEDSDLDFRKSLRRRVRYHLSRNLETFVVRRADAVVGIAQSILKELQSRGIPAAKLHHAANGVDIARFTPRARDSALSADLGIDGVPTLGFLGTLFPWEGIPWLVQAAAELRRGGLQFKLLIVGDGTDRSEVQKAILETGSANDVLFLGRVANDQVERYYSVMDVLVYPRRSVRIAELVTPLKPLEAMAFGKAVLGSGVGGIRELIAPEVTGLLFSPENIAEFCRQASRLLSDADLRRKLGDNARKQMAEERDWKVLVRGYESVYNSAIRNARSRA